MISVSRPVTRGSEAPLENFLASLEKFVGYILKLLDIVQKIWAPLRKLFPLLASQAGYGPVRIPSDSCFSWNHTIRIRKLSKSEYFLWCTIYMFVLCLFCLIRQKHCWSYFAFSWTWLVKVITCRRGFTIRLKRLKPKVPDFGRPQNFGSKDNFQHFRKQLYWYSIFALVQGTFFCYADKKDLYRTGVGNLRPTDRIRPAKQNNPARNPFTTCSNCMARLAVIYFRNLPSLRFLVLHAYEELLMRNGTVL